MDKRIYGNLLMFISGLCVGLALLWRIFLGQDQEDMAPPESAVSMEAERAEISEPAYVEIVVDYPFSYREEGWSLILREDREKKDVGLCAGREFCLYDENGQILQTFSCDIEAGELIFRFDVLFDYYDDLIVFPAGAQEEGTDGLCYQWESEKQRFVEKPVIIPWYQEGSVRDKAFLVSGAQERVQTNIICRINEESRSVVELRRWTLGKDEATGEESLCICDCLEGQDIYAGKVKRYETGDLVNEKYYQYLFWNGLKDFWSPEKNEPIRVQKETQEKAVSREGFVLDETVTGFWKPQDTFSRLSVSGEDVREYHVPGYREIYEYTDDGRLSSFEARGTDECEHEPVEVSLLSMDYIYRSDGTLCHKEYHHYPMLFGTTCQSQLSDYDEQGRLVFQYGYITHGALEDYYIYREDSIEPAYCLHLDWGGAYASMAAFGSGN